MFHQGMNLDMSQMLMIIKIDTKQFYTKTIQFFGIELKLSNV